MPTSEPLLAEAEAVHDRRSLVRYAERALSALADDHAITGSSLADSWALVPTSTDLWLERSDSGALVTAVRSGSAAEAAGVRPGDRLTAVDGVPLAVAVRRFWEDLGLTVTADLADHAARVLAAGRRDRPRTLTFERLADVTLPSVGRREAASGPVEVTKDGGVLVIRFNDSLGDAATIDAFDMAITAARPGVPFRLDLTDTPSGGNTTGARAILGWFVDRSTSYQVHSLPREERDTGVARQWVEQALPRPGRHHAGPVEVRVGRWTGSMGEGLAIGFDALGVRVCGDRMVELRGAAHDLALVHSHLVLKLPVERLTHVDGTPHEAFAPPACGPSLTH